MQQKRSTMYFIAIPYKMTGQLVLFICQSHFFLHLTVGKY